MAHDDQQHSTTSEVGAGVGDFLRLIPAVVLILALVLFAFANTQKTKVDLLFTEKSLPLWAVLLVTAVVGAIIAALIKFKRRH